jgi:aerobic carbon-monoxide dehydrogenase small subunit
MSSHHISLTINGAPASAEVPARLTLLDFLRGECGLTGAHAGCEHGVCGACTVICDGAAVRSCLMLAVQADGAELRTIESVAEPGAPLHPIQQALHEEGGLQCGFCTPGIVMTLVAAKENEPGIDAEGLKRTLSGHICRCTGYQGISRAIDRIARQSA